MTVEGSTRMRPRRSLMTLRTMLGLVISALIVVFVLAAPVFAQVDLTTETAAVGEATGLSAESPMLIIGRIIQVILGFLGVILLVIVIYAGWLYMTAGGNEDNIKKAKQYILNGVIGLVIILSAFAITTFILNKLSEATGIGLGEGVSGAYMSPGIGSSAFGTIIQEHFPGVGMTVPRNTVIMVTFKEAFDPLSILANDDARKCLNSAGQACTAAGNVGTDCVCRGHLNPEAVLVYRACDTTYPTAAIKPEQFSEDNRNNPLICNDWAGDAPTDETKLVTQGDVIITPDFKTFVFNPYGTDAANHLGTATSDIGYFTKLTNKITKLVNKSGMFGATQAKSYTWNFTTNTTIDITPPFVTGVYPVVLDKSGQPIPADSKNAFDRNKRIRIDFSEPVLPPIYLVQNPDVVQPTAEIVVAYGADKKLVAGNYSVGINQYRSVLFKPSAGCGAGAPLTNSCGDLLTCLPANAVITTTAHSVPTSLLLNGTGPGATVFPAGGIVDAALNALDTNGKLGKADGATTGTPDDFSWTFMTSDTLDLLPPKIVTNPAQPSPVDGASIGTTPQFGADQSTGNIDPFAVVSAHFTESIDPSTSTNKEVSIYSDKWSRWYSGSLYCPLQVAADGSPFCMTNDTVVMINHGPFNEAKDAADVPLYFPKITSGVQDMAGNCFNPVIGPLCDNVNLVPGQACCAEFGPNGGKMVPQVDAQGKPMSKCPY